MSKFRSEAGIRYTKALFQEMAYGDKAFVLYTLKDEDTEFPSLYKLYMSMEDPTEHQFAKTYLEGWEHWLLLCETSWFKPIVRRWREELELKIRANALGNVLAVSKDPDNKYFYEANKFILAGNWRPSDKLKVGRPSKQAIKEQAEELFNTEKQIKEDWMRIVEDKS